MKLRVYLAGPITGCNDEQVHWWREEVKKRLGKQFECEDPTDWADDVVLTREIPKLEACDVLVANMWKESIGTTLGVIRARQQGKPVILIDPNRIGNRTLAAMIEPEKPVHTVEEACRRLRELAEEFKSFIVMKGDGTEQSFSAKKLAKSISQACSAAGVNDPMFHEQVLGPVVARLRHEGGSRGKLPSSEIRDRIFRRLELMRDDPQLAADVRSRASEVVRAWEFKEASRQAEETVRSAEQRAMLAEEDAAGWKQLVQEMRKRQTEAAPVSASPAAEGEQAGPRFKNTTQVLDAVSKKWGAFLVFHDRARSGAKKLKLKAAGLDALHGMLDELGQHMQERVYAQADGDELPRLEDRFGDKYAPTESGATKERYRKAPLAEYNGRKCFGLRHLKLKTDGVHVRIHFDDISPGRLLICHVGEHLATYGHDG